MAKYGVYMMNVVSTIVKVEADSEDEAIEKAFEEGAPGLMFLDYTYPDEGDWESPSTLFPGVNQPEDDVYLIEED